MGKRYLRLLWPSVRAAHLREVLAALERRSDPDWKRERRAYSCVPGATDLRKQTTTDWCCWRRSLHMEYVLAGTQSEERRKMFAAALRRHLPGRGGELMTYVEQIEARGELKGREAGREAGREEGLEQGLEQERRLLCRQAARKFGAEAGSRLSDLLQREADPERLAQVGEWVIECATEGELLARVQDSTP